MTDYAAPRSGRCTHLQSLAAPHVPKSNAPPPKLPREGPVLPSIRPSAGTSRLLSCPRGQFAYRRGWGCWCQCRSAEAIWCTHFQGKRIHVLGCRFPRVPGGDFNDRIAYHVHNRPIEPYALPLQPAAVAAMSTSTTFHGPRPCWRRRPFAGAWA